MAHQKQAAIGTILELDETATELPPGVPAYTPIVCVTSLTPPAQEREEADDRCLGDLFDVPTPGGEAQSEMLFTHSWHPGETDDSRLQTLFTSKASAAWKIIFPHDDPAKTWEFLGYVRMLTPAALEATGVYSRDCAVRRTSGILEATATAQMMEAIKKMRQAYGLKRAEQIAQIQKATK